MSLEPRVYFAELDGWNGPYFPEGIEKLTRAIGVAGLQHQTLLDFCVEANAGMSGRMAAVTTDEYHWYDGIVFANSRGSAALLVPWYQNLNGHPTANRSATVYTQGGWSPNDSIILLIRLTTVIDRHIPPERQPKKSRFYLVN